MSKKTDLEQQQLESIASKLAELGHPTRLSLFKTLVKSGADGVPVGTLQQKIGIPASTLSHHISKMVHVGLITQRRESRTLYCIPKFEALMEVIDFLNDECCADQKAVEI